MSDYRGMTLVEVLLVLLLIALMLTWAIPSLQAVTARYKREQDMQVVLRALGHARKISILQQTTVLVCSHGMKDDWQAGFDLRVNQEIIRQFAALSAKSHLYWRGFGDGSCLHFNASLIANQSNGHFDYVPAGAVAVSDRIIVNRAGYIHRQRVN